MSNLLSFIILLPLTVWAMFTPLLVTNASTIEETVNLAIFEGQKSASLAGQYNEDIYKEIRDFLVDNHNYDPTAIQLSGTEVLTARGGDLTITATIPKPPTSVLDLFRTPGSETFEITRTIKSEYNL